MERKLASVQVVSQLNPITGADLIEQARVLGWSMVVKKNEFKVGDLAVFFEIDSLLPETPAFEFMRKHKFRVKSAKFKGTLAQGLCLPLSLFPEVEDKTVGTDVTQLLGVTKYEPPVPASLSGLMEGSFPGYVPKTDEMRLQSFPELLAEIRGVPCYATVKLDGASATFSHHEGELKACSRNWSYKDSPTDLRWILDKKYGILEKLKNIGSFAVQGEVCGPGIQKNHLGLNEVDFFAFNVYDIKSGLFLGLEDMRKFLGDMGVPMVPVERTGWILDDETVDTLLQKAEGVYSGSGKPREGIVVRPMKPMYSATLGGRFSFKVINNTFLLKNED